MSAYPFLTQLDPKLFKGRDVYGVFGNPIGHSKSPQIHEQFAVNSHQALVYLRIQPPLDAFKKMMSEFFQMGGKGGSVTVPFKVEAHDLCSQLSPRAKLAGAVNTVWQENGLLCGDNTDGIGLVRDLLAQGVILKEKKVLIVGAGGASRGIIQPILLEKPRSLMIANRTASKANNLVKLFQEIANELNVEIDSISIADLEKEISPSFDVVINASAAGLADQSPFSEHAAKHIFQANSFAYDLVYGKTTVFMQQALQNGCRVSDGLGMLVEQAAEAFRQWRKIDDLKVLNTPSVIASLR